MDSSNSPLLENSYMNNKKNKFLDIGIVLLVVVAIIITIIFIII